MPWIDAILQHQPDTGGASANRQPLLNGQFGTNTLQEKKIGKLGTLPVFGAR